MLDTVSNARQSRTPKLDEARAIVRALRAAGKKAVPHKLEKQHGISHVMFDVAIAVERAVDDERGQREAREDRAIARLPEKDQIKLAEAIRIYQARIQYQMHNLIETEVRKRIAIANKASSEYQARLLKENLYLESMRGAAAVFSKAEFRQMQMLCHPDNPASPEMRNALSQLLVENERRLVK